MYGINSDKIVFMARQKRPYQSTRIKLNISFEEALAKLCYTSWRDESTIDDDSGSSESSFDKEKPVEPGK